MSTIPASRIAQVTPNVLAAGGRALDIIGLMLTTSARVPIGAVLAFATQLDVAAYFGSGSAEAQAATNYFLGFDNSNIKPGSVKFAQYNTAAVGAWLRGATLGMTLTQLQAVAAGEITIAVQGVNKTSASIDLSGATSFSDAASIIQAAFTSPGFTVAYDSQSGAFQFNDTTTGSSSTLGYGVNATGTIATDLKLTQVTGAVLSQGAAAATPTAFMDGVVAVDQDWATFMTIFDPDNSGNANKLLFAQWVNGQNDQYAYVCWDTDASPSTDNPATGSLGYLIAQAALSGTFLIGRDTTGAIDYTYAAFACGSAASIDFTELNGRITFAFRSQSGLVATVSGATAADNLIANGYNFYGAYATRNSDFIFLYDGQVSGVFKWFDSFINQIWMNSEFVLALMNLLTAAKSIPYNAAGYALIEAALLDPVLAAGNFGAWRPGVTLSQAQRAEVNNAAGTNIADTLEDRGWYLQILDASPEVRQARGSPPCTFWYMDGESVQKINLTSVNVQ